MNGYASILSLLITTTFMALANGLLGTLVPLTAKAWQFYPGELGAISSAYFAGMLAGAFIAPWLIRRVGHIRTLTGCMALAAIASLGMIVNVEVFTWVALRFVTGFAFAGVYAAIEAWLQAARPTRSGAAFSPSTACFNMAAGPSATSSSALPLPRIIRYIRSARQRCASPSCRSH